MRQPALIEIAGLCHKPGDLPAADPRCFKGEVWRRSSDGWWMLCVVGAILLGFSPSGRAQSTHLAAGVLPTLTSVRAVHNLGAVEAQRSYPVDLKAVVTYFDPYIDHRHYAMFVQDASGGVFVDVPPSAAVPGIEAGTEIEVTGVTGPGDFAAVVRQPQIRVLHRGAALPAPELVNLTQLLSGSEDCKRVEVEGTVQAVHETAKNVILELAMKDGLIRATAVKTPDIDLSSLVDARIRLQATAAPLFNANMQMTGARLFFPEISAITVQEKPHRDPFSLELTPIGKLSARSVGFGHRVHIRGAVTLQWPGNLLCLQDQAQGVCVQTTQTLPVSLGATVDVLGFVSLDGGYKPTLKQAVYRVSGAAQPVAPAIITAQTALHGDPEAELVQIKGRLIGTESAVGDPALVLSTQKAIFVVVLPPGSAKSVVSKLAMGSELSVTGICSVQVDTARTQVGDGATLIKSFRILLRSPSDLVVLETPSYWTASRILVLLILVAGSTLAILGWVAVLRRRVEQQTRLIRASEERFRHLAHHDALTGLPTRTLLNDRLVGALERARRFRTSIALLMIDLDNFKQVNDSLGHAAGDQTLCVVARRISSVIRKTDTVARMGGDEFVVLLSDVIDISVAEQIAQKLIATLAMPVLIGEREVPISASVGVHTISNGECDADALLKSADAAMYHAKEHGRNCFQVFTSDMERAALERMELQVGLSRALELEEFRLQYQAIVDLETGELTGFEALIRWHSGQLGKVMPNEFIPIAEATGKIVAIGNWVLRQACQDIASLERQLNRKLILSVNLSPRQMVDANLPESICAVLAETGLAPERLWLEITENILLDDSSHTRRTLDRLRECGVRLVIDDFGKGFSNLSYISRFAVDWIKIDRSLLRNCNTDRKALAVIRAIVTMAHGLSIRIVAEGVETMEQYELLKAEGCDTAQGYFLSQPADASALPELISGFDHLNHLLGSSQSHIMGPGMPLPIPDRIF